MAGGYSSVTITVDSSSKKPIEGSVSVSVEEGEITELKYEGGEVADSDIKDPKVIMEWKVPGSATASVEKNQTATLEATGDSGSVGTGSIAVTGTLYTNPGWDSNWGCVTHYKIVGTSGSSS